MPALKKIADFLDRELNVAGFSDRSNNGLQVESDGPVRRVCCGVDASLDFFHEARRRGADLLVCHHGLSWADSLKRITGSNYRHVSFLIRNRIALYACHLPLDAHPRYGNNALIAKTLRLRRLRPFGLYQGSMIGVQGQLPAPLPYEKFLALVRRTVGPRLQTMDHGGPVVRSVAIVSGGGSGELAEAGEKNIDVFLSGEPTLKAWNIARECGIHAVFAGHYATEVFGVRALAGLLRRKFKLPAEFIELDVPF